MLKTGDLFDPKAGVALPALSGRRTPLPQARRRFTDCAFRGAPIRPCRDAAEIIPPQRKHCSHEQIASRT